jgi:hypothetical protein
VRQSAQQRERVDHVELQPSTPTATGLDELVAGVRSVVDRHAGWRETDRLVAGELSGAYRSPKR